MLDDEEDAEHHRYQSHYGTKVKGKSPDDEIADTLNDYVIRNSKALKNMQAKVL